MTTFKVRVASMKKLQEFDSLKDLFDWAKHKVSPDSPYISVLMYEGDSLESMERYFYNGQRFMRENVTY